MIVSRTIFDTSNMSSADLISSPKLKTLIEAGALQHLIARGVPGGFVLVAKVGMRERTLEAQRGGVRIFKSANGLVGYARTAGARHVDIDLAGYDPSNLLF